jgi:1-acyl-sn-glycerol-3-phosphate acyltransferase
MRPTPIQIHILDPIYPEQFIQRNSSGEIDEDNIRQTAQKMTTELENTIREKGKVFYG